MAICSPQRRTSFALDVRHKMITRKHDIALTALWVLGLEVVEGISTVAVSSEEMGKELTAFSARYCVYLFG